MSAHELQKLLKQKDEKIAQLEHLLEAKEQKIQVVFVLSGFIL